MPDQIVVATVTADDQAILGITWNGQYGELPSPIEYDSTDDAIRQMAVEAVSSGLPGISADGNANFTDFIVERFPAVSGSTVNRVQLRPKVVFG